MEDKVIKDAVESVVDSKFVPEKQNKGNQTGNPAKKPDSALTKKVKVIAIWVGAFVGFGLIVFLLAYFLMFRPLKLAHDSLTANADEMETQLAAYRDEISAKDTQIAEMQTNVEGLQTENALYTDYVVYLKLLNNLSQMQKAQMMGDAASMRVALANAEENLAKLLPMISAVDASLGELLQERLALLASSTADAEEIYQEVETVYVYLLELQETLFGDVY